MGCLGAPDPTEQLADEAIWHKVLQISAPEHELLISWLLAPTCFLKTNATVLDSEGKEVVKDHFLHGDVIPAIDFVMITKKHRWLWEVDGHMMLLYGVAILYL